MSEALLVNFVLDASPSMEDHKAATIEGFNAFLHDQQKSENAILFSLTSFSTSFDVRHVAVPVGQVADLGTPQNPYVPMHGNGTALHDATVTTIKGIEAWLAKHPEWHGNVLCVIQTDGEENTSKEYDLTDVNVLMEKKTAEGWQFAFMGAGKDAWAQGQKFTSVPQASNFNYVNTDHSTSTAYRGLSGSVSAYAAASAVAPESASFSNLLTGGAVIDDDTEA